MAKYQKPKVDLMAKYKSQKKGRLADCNDQMNFCSLKPTPLGGSCGQRRQVRPLADNGGNLEAFAISFAKLVQIMEKVDIHKTIDVVAV